MTATVVHFHPLETSFTAAMRDRAIAGLRARRGSEPTVIELTAQPSGQRLADPETLVLVYPTWWAGQPAALTQWLFDVRDQLRSVRRLVAVSSHGSPKRINLLEGENGRRLLRKVVLPRCASGATFEWLAFYNIDAAPESKRLAFLNSIEQRLAKP